MPLTLYLPEKWVLGRTSFPVRGAWVSATPGSSCKEAWEMGFSSFHFGDIGFRNWNFLQCSTNAGQAEHEKCPWESLAQEVHQIHTQPLSSLANSWSRWPRLAKASPPPPCNLDTSLKFFKYIYPHAGPYPQHKGKSQAGDFRRGGDPKAPWKAYVRRLPALGPE